MLYGTKESIILFPGAVNYAVSWRWRFLFIPGEGSQLPIVGRTGRFGTLVCFVGEEIFGMIRGCCAAEFREENIVVWCFCHCVWEHPMRQGPIIFLTGLISNNSYRFILNGPLAS